MNIIVFKSPETDIKINKTERDIQYELFTKKASIPAHHFASFAEMEQIEDNDIEINSTIPSILIKSIIHYCTPIIKNVPLFTAKTKQVVFNRNEKTENKENKEKEGTKESYIISLQLEKSIVAILNKDIIVIPKNQTFQIIGVNVPQHFVKRVDESFLNYFRELSVTYILSSGKFGLADYQTDIYTQSLIPEI